MGFLWIVLLLVPILVATGGLVVAVIILVDGPNPSSEMVEAMIVLILLCSTIDIYLIRLLRRALKPEERFLLHSDGSSESETSQPSFAQKKIDTNIYLIPNFWS